MTNLELSNACARSRCKPCRFIHNVETLSEPKRSINITDHFTSTSTNATYCITCTYCKKLHIERSDEDASKPVARHFNLPNYSKQHMVVCGLSQHLGSLESRKTLEQKFSSQISTLNPHSINERFSFN